MHISGATTMTTPIEQKIDNNLKVGKILSFRILGYLGKLHLTH